MALKDIPAVPDDRVFVCVGHGSFNAITDEDNKTFTVPDDVWIAFWVYDRETFAGKAIEEYRRSLPQVNPLMLRGDSPDSQGFQGLRMPVPGRKGQFYPRDRRFGGKLEPEVQQSVAAAAAAAGSAADRAADSAGSAQRRRAWGPGRLASELANSEQFGVNSGEVTAMGEELRTNRGILLSAQVPDSRARRSSLPEVISPGHECPYYRLTWDPRLCDEYMSGGKNSLIAGGLPAFLLADQRYERSEDIRVRGTPLERFARLVADRGGATPAVIHWAACRAHLER